MGMKGYALIGFLVDLLLGNRQRFRHEPRFMGDQGLSQGGAKVLQASGISGQVGQVVDAIIQHRAANRRMTVKIGDRCEVDRIDEMTEVDVEISLESGFVGAASANRGPLRYNACAARIVIDVMLAGITGLGGLAKGIE